MPRKPNRPTNHAHAGDFSAPFAVADDIGMAA